MPQERGRRYLSRAGRTVLLGLGVVLVPVWGPQAGHWLYS